MPSVAKWEKEAELQLSFQLNPVLKDYLPPPPENDETGVRRSQGERWFGLAANSEEAHTLRSQRLFVQDSERRVQSWMKPVAHLSPAEMRVGVLR